VPRTAVQVHLGKSNLGLHKREHARVTMYIQPYILKIYACISKHMRVYWVYIYIDIAHKYAICFIQCIIIKYTRFALLNIHHWCASSVPRTAVQVHLGKSNLGFHKREHEKVTMYIQPYILGLPGGQLFGICLGLDFISQLSFSRIKNKFDAMKVFTFCRGGK